MEHLPDEVMTLVSDKLASHQGSLWALHNASVATRSAAAKTLDDAYEERLCELLAAMRVRVEPKTRPWRKLMADMSNPQNSPQIALQCGRCGRVADGILLCECHAHKAHKFPWQRAFVGPIIASATIVVFVVVSRRF